MKRSNKLSAGGALPATLLMAVTALAVTACGGGGGDKNGAPTLSVVSTQTINQDTSTGPLAITVGDDSSVDGVVLTATSSNGNIIAPEGITFGGNGANRTITLVPTEDAVGTTGLNITATDAQGNASSSSFQVNVKAVEQSVTSYTNLAYAQMEGDTALPVSGFTFTQDAEAETTFDPLLQ